MNSFKYYLVLICLLFLFLSCFINGDERLRKVYDQLGCSPIPSNSSKPEAYNCDNIFSQRRDVCYFNGHVYHVKDRLTDEDKAAHPCLSDCRCKYFDKSNLTYMSCIVESCKEDVLNEIEFEDGSYYQFSKNKCCEVGTYSPNEKTPIHQCIYNEKTYRDGERIFINDYTCICSPRFNGVVDDQNCRKRRCDFDAYIVYTQILDKGAAVFSGNPLLTAFECPTTWYSPKYNKGQLIETDTSELSNSTHKCQYGEMKLSIGQKIELEDDYDGYERNCSCRIPPFVSCTNA